MQTNPIDQIKVIHQLISTVAKCTKRSLTGQREDYKEEVKATRRALKMILGREPTMIEVDLARADHWQDMPLVNGALAAAPN